MTKSRVAIILIMIALVVALLAIGAFFDMDISNELYEGKGNLNALLGGLFGKLPAYLILSFCFAIMLSYVKTYSDNYEKWLRVILYIAYIGAMLVGYVLAIFSAFEEITSTAKYLAVGAGAVLTAITCYIVMKKDFSHLEELKKWAILTIIGIGVLLVATTGIKMVWGRQRYMDIIAGNASFTNWYLPQGFTHGSSFPSGHTALWGALYFLIPLLGIFGYKGEFISFVTILVTQLLVGVFRIIGGYHFLSDITMSIAISFTIAFVVNLIGYNKDYTNTRLSEKNVFRMI